MFSQDKSTMDSSSALQVQVTVADDSNLNGPVQVPAKSKKKKRTVLPY